MINRLFGFFSAQRQLVNPWHLPLTGLLLTIGLTTPASTREIGTSPQHEQAFHPTAAEIAAHKPAIATSLPDGTYLYGESSQPEQIGKEYIVFEARQGKLVGALYLPYSEFSCFYGTLDSEQMNLTVVNPYDQTAVSHTIARAKPQPIAAVGGQFNLETMYESLTYPYSVRLEGYQPLSQLSDNDERILGICRDNYR